MKKILSLILLATLTSSAVISTFAMKIPLNVEKTKGNFWCAVNCGKTITNYLCSKSNRNPNLSQEDFFKIALNKDNLENSDFLTPLPHNLFLCNGIINEFEKLKLDHSKIKFHFVTDVNEDNGGCTRKK